jgi:fatty acid synthase subunit alpha, fungi type
MCYLARYLGRDSRAGEVAFDQEKATSLALQAKLDSTNREHNDAYIEGIQPRFDILKARHFDSSWNWVRQLEDALLMYYDIIFGRFSTTVDREITVRCIALLNRADPDMLQFVQYNIDQCDALEEETYKLAKEFHRKLIDNTREVIGKPHVQRWCITFTCRLSIFIINSFFLKLLSLLRHSQRRAKSNIPKLFAKMSINLKPMLRRWPVGTLSRVQSTSKRFKMMF